MLHKFTIFNITETQNDESNVEHPFSSNILIFAKIYIEYRHFVGGGDNVSTTKPFRFWIKNVSSEVFRNEI